MRCVHCEKPITQKQPRYCYTESRADAHLACVSLVSARATDLYMKHAIDEERHSNSRLVYSSPVKRAR
jgi:hypothetical protein